MDSRKIGVVDAGTMGSGTGQVMAVSGLDGFGDSRYRPRPLWREKVSVRPLFRKEEDQLIVAVPQNGIGPSALPEGSDPGRLGQRQDDAPAPDCRSGRFERQGWQDAAHVYHDFWGNLTQQLVEPMLDALSVNSGCTLLDVACGPGYVAAAAAKRGACAMGVDFSAEVLATAERLHPNVQFLEGDAESLPLNANGFSAVAMNYGIHHLNRPMLALNSIRRVLRPGGRIALSIWASTDATKGASIVYAAVKKYGTLNAELPPAPPLWRLDTPDAACGVLRAAGFVDALAVHVAQTWHLASADDFFRAFYDASVRTKALLRAQSPQALAMIRREIELALRPYARAGRIEIPMAAVLASARKPCQCRNTKLSWHLEQ